MKKLLSAALALAMLLTVIAPAFAATPRAWDAEKKDFVLTDGPEIVRLNTVKDNTDTQAAVSLALERGADQIVIVGGLAGRLDHTLANLFILEYLYSKGVWAVITDGRSRARFMRSSSALIGRSPYRYLSVIAADSRVKGVEIDGCKYPLKGGRIDRTVQYAVSNEIEGNCALISVRHGGVFIIESRDA